MNELERDSNPTNCMESQMNLRRFTNIQISLLEMVMVICSWVPTKEPILSKR